MSKDSRSQRPGSGSSRRGGSSQKPSGRKTTTRKPAAKKSAARKPPAKKSQAKKPPAQKPGSGRTSDRARRAAMYRRRRTVLATVAVLVLAAAIFGIAQGVSFVKTQFGSDEPEAAPSATAESTGPSEEELANPETCRSTALALTVAPENTTAPAGAGVQVPITITNEGKVQCLIDVGNANLQMVITSGDDTVWTTAQCPANPQEHQVLLAPGASEQDTITWSGNRSAEGCPQDAQVAGPGTYRIEVTLSAGGGKLTEKRTLEVTEAG